MILKKHLTKIVGALISLLCLILVIFDFNSMILADGKITLSLPDFILIICSLFTLITSFISNKIFITIMFLLLYYLDFQYSFPIQGIISVATVPLIAFGINRYKKKKSIKKPLLLLLFLASLFILSALKWGINISRILEMVMFSLALISFFFYIFGARIEKFNKTIALYVENLKYLEHLNIESIDPRTINLSKEERNVMDNLCIYRESNDELAYRLNKSVSTLKSQINSILQKSGLHSRYQIIEHSKKFYLEKALNPDFDTNKDII